MSRGPRTEQEWRAADTFRTRQLAAHGLVATGVNADGHREIPGVDVCSAESHTGWLAFFRGLTAHGCLRAPHPRAGAGPDQSSRICPSLVLAAATVATPDGALPAGAPPEPYGPPPGPPELGPCRHRRIDGTP
jgi:hypothetical protein